MEPTRIGILIIGSLFWRGGPVRAGWRNAKLQANHAIRVKAPIHYGRMSRNATYTMTLAPAVKSGTALVLPCQSSSIDLPQLKAEAEALWGAEKDGVITRAISADWGCVGALFRDRLQNPELVASWSRYFQEAGAGSVSPVDEAGHLQIPWPERVNGQPLDLDVLLATSNLENGTPTPDQIADAWMEHAGTEEYFFKNVLHGIRTPDDAAIWRRMETRAEWLRQAAAAYPEAVAILRGNYPVHTQKLPTVRYFAPETWGAVERFSHLSAETYHFPPHIHGCVTGTTANFQRAELLRKIAMEMVPLLQADRAELEAKGFTQAEEGRKLTAVLESSVTALYSSLDSARKVVTHVFSKHQGLPESTRKTFQNSADGKLDPRLPERIRHAFATASWYPRFRRLRDALTHVGPGSCHLENQTGKVMYFHDAIREGTTVTHIPDIFATLDVYFQDVNLFLGQVFTALLETLKDDEVWQMCGVFGGRIYSRFVRPSEAKNIHSGRCDAYKWFELPENPWCPLADKCEAYKRRRAEP